MRPTPIARFRRSTKVTSTRCSGQLYVGETRAVWGSVRRDLLVVHRRLTSVFGAFFLDISEVLIEHDSAFAGERDETLAPRPPDQRQIGFARQINAPGRKTRARNQDRDSHAHGLDHHFGGEAAGGVENLVRWIDAILEHPAGDLVDGIMTA